MKTHKGPKASGKGEEADRNFIAVLDKSLRILRSFTPDDVWLGSTEIARRESLLKPTASRLAKSLAAMNYLHYSPHRRKYRLGIGVLALGYAARAERSAGQLIRPYLQQLADEYGVHVSLVVRDNTDALHLEVCHSSNTLMTLRIEAGTRIPLAGTATGHALLAAASEPELAYLMAYLQQRHSKHWTEIGPLVYDGIEQVKKHGYTISERGWQTDINGVAVPLKLPGAQTYVLACGAPALHLPRAKLQEIGARLLSIVGQLNQLAA